MKSRGSLTGEGRHFFGQLYGFAALLQKVTRRSQNKIAHLTGKSVTFAGRSEQAA
jgi:hypothetical protein